MCQHILRPVCVNLGLRMKVFMSSLGETVAWIFQVQLSFANIYMQAVQVAESMLGPYGQLAEGSRHAIEDGHWAFLILFARRYGIAGGTNDIQKNIIGERQLGLPK